MLIEKSAVNFLLIFNDVNGVNDKSIMPLKYKIDVLNGLKEKGYNSNRIRTEGLLSQSTLQKFRNNQGVSWENLETLCKLLECQPGDLIEYIDVPEEK